MKKLLKPKKKQKPATVEAVQEQIEAPDIAQLDRDTEEAIKAEETRRSLEVYKPAIITRERSCCGRCC